MLVFLDTEFTDFIDCELISIGMVTETGGHFYAEVMDFDRDKCNQFVRAAVLSVLGQVEGASITRTALPARIRAWFANLPANVTVASDSSFDVDLLKNALDGELPANLTGLYDLRELTDKGAFNQAVVAYHGLPGCPWHHALHDAMAHRAGWLATDGRMGNEIP